jgi:heme-degrading monooxygenase HmoA
MIVRIWTADALDENAEDYRRHFHDILMPKLRAIDGFISAEALERVTKSRIEFVIITRWENLDSIRAFAGHHEERAVIEPDIRAALERYDETVKHYVHVAEERR